MGLLDKTWSDNGYMQIKGIRVVKRLRLDTPLQVLLSLYHERIKPSVFNPPYKEKSRF